MTHTRTIRWVIGIIAFGVFGSASSANAQVGVGTWSRQGVQQPGAIGQPMTMTVEACCGSGRRLVYRISGVDLVLTVESPFDGSEVPVLMAGKPSGETMAIKQVDDRHWTTVLKMNGQLFGTSKATLSPDGRTLTVENDMTATAGTTPAGKSTETWVKK
jgi:hypothetical protein